MRFFDWVVDWLFEILAVVIVVAVIVGFPIAIIASERSREAHDKSKQLSCTEKLNGLVVPSSEGWVCAVPNRTLVEK